MTKICARCFKEKSISEFYSNPHSADGHVNFCKTCKGNYDVARINKVVINAELLRGWGRCEVL